MIFSIKNQSIRVKVFLAIFANTILFATGIYFFSTFFINKSYLSLEEQDVLTNIDRTKNTLQSVNDNLDTKMSDWSNWDDTYLFMKDKNSDYIKANLDNNALTLLKINAMVFISTDGKIFYSLAQDSNNELTDVGEINSYLEDNISFFNLTHIKSFISGTIKIRNENMIVSAKPILKTDGTGPLVGTLVFIKFIDNNFVKNISTQTKLSIDLYPYDIPSLDSDIITAKNNLSISNNFFSTPISNDSVAGYFLLNDIKNNPISIFKITLPRKIFNQGQSTLSTFTLIILFAALFFGLIIIFVFDKFLMRRLIKLTQEVHSISDKESDLKRVTEDSKDEIGDLASRINSMLDNLLIAEEIERKANEAQREASEKLKEQMIEATKLNDLMLGRESRIAELKEEIIRLKK